ncbi:MAG: NUDIX hydrolase [Dehalococcoidia bacterium]|nr:NUDIX hydrolase [Dehalococcoidia bacterium]
MAKERVVRSQRVYEGKIVNLRVETVQMEKAGRLLEVKREIVEHAPAVVIVPVDDQGRVLLVKQFRLATGEELLEVPAGGMERGEDPKAAVQRELQEETGFAADEVVPLGRFWMTPGWSTEEMHAFLARGLRPGTLRQEEDEDIRVVPVPLSEVPERIKRGELRDAKSIAALMMALFLFSDEVERHR